MASYEYLFGWQCLLGLSAYAISAPFAATRVDGTVATWGDPRNGGNSSEVQDSSGLRYEWDVFFCLGAISQPCYHVVVFL